MKLSIVIPTYRGAARLSELLCRITACMQKEGYRNFEIILVDDGSEEPNWEQIRSLAADYPAVSALRLKENSGQQLATLAGLDRASGEWILTMDDDLEHPPEDIPHLFAKASEGFDLVYGVRTIQYASLIRRTGNTVRNFIFRLCLKTRGGTRLSSFRIMKARLVRKVLEGPCPYPYLSAMAFQYRPAAASVQLSPVKRHPGRQRLLPLIRMLSLVWLAYSHPRRQRAPAVFLPAIADSLENSI